ncbi:MAG: UPF0175 family protein [Planctomycetia bacterium]|nr:UPF0175 family protein [Planctomycetia bacterium]
MSQQTIELNDELVAVLNSLNQPVRQSIPELVVLELYRRGLISSGKAAEWFGLGRAEFISHASQLGIPFFDMTASEWESERQNAETL